MVRVSVAHPGVYRSTNAPVVILREVGGERTLPIWIGTSEASAIALELQGIRPERPMLHDLLRHLVGGLGGELRRVNITVVRDDTYFAELLIHQGSGSCRWMPGPPTPSRSLSL